jgi:hypothetical protein
VNDECETMTASLIFQPTESDLDESVLVASIYTAEANLNDITSNYSAKRRSAPRLRASISL